MKKLFAFALIALLLSVAAASADTLNPADAVPDVPRVCCFRLEGKTLSDYVDMQKVNSSLFSEVGYNPEVKHLFVRFADSGAAYVYTNLTQEYFTGMMQAESIGTYFNKTIKGNFPCFRIYFEDD